MRIPRGTFYSRSEYSKAYQLATEDRRKDLAHKRYLERKPFIVKVVLTDEQKARHNKWQIKWNHEHKPSVIEYRLKRMYGITLAQYQDLLNKQDNKCAICAKTPKQEGKNLAVDHCHKTNKVRGLLCLDCNTAIGRFKEDRKLFERALEYLNV